ncbi:MAG TPA: primase-like DNA-binding domain-containing protein, partial [Anaerolineales bacterium]|nr:primase-like DNA-binding domain-containing protein [Anaerolineales bacterium]
AKIIWAMNDFPEIKSANDGLLRRVKVIEFPSIPVDERDHTLKDEIKSEASGILNIALGGLDRLRERGAFDPAQVVIEATQSLNSQVDVPAAFVNECCEVDDAFNIQSQALYTAYSNWCRINGHHPLSSTKMAKEWERLGYKKYRANGKVRWDGIRLQIP